MFVICRTGLAKQFFACSVYFGKMTGSGYFRLVTAKKLAIALTLIIVLVDCHKARRKELVSVINVADPSIAKQLVGGFYKIEAKNHL